MYAYQLLINIRTVCVILSLPHIIIGVLLYCYNNLPLGVYIKLLSVCDCVFWCCVKAGATVDINVVQQLFIDQLWQTCFKKLLANVIVDYSFHRLCCHNISKTMSQ